MIAEAQKRALPARPSLEHLSKEAKRELAGLRLRAQSVQLADAQLLVARAYGFSSWRALRREGEQRRASLGMLPPAFMGDILPRRPARALPWVPDAAQAEDGFFRVCAFSALSTQAAIPLVALISYLLT